MFDVYLESVSECLIFIDRRAVSLIVRRQFCRMIGEIARTYAHKHTHVQVQCNCGIYMRLSCTDVTHRSSCYHNESGVILCFSGLCIINCSGDKMLSVCNSVWCRQCHRNYTTVFAPVVGFWICDVRVCHFWMCVNEEGFAGMRVTFLRQSLPMLTLSS